MTELRDVPCLYLFLYQALLSLSSSKFFITYSEAKEVLNRRLYKIPKKLYPQVLRDMENYNLLKTLGAKNSLRFEFLEEDVAKMLNNYTLFF